MNNTEATRRTLIAGRLKEARKLAGLSQGHVAKILGLHRPSISEIGSWQPAGSRPTNSRALPKFTTWASPGCSARRLTPSTPRILDLNSAARELTKLKPDDLDRLLKLLAAMAQRFHSERRERQSVTTLMPITKSKFKRRALANQAMQAAIATRAKAKLDQHGPICIYGLAETLGVTVRFNNINMEGMYQRGAPPRIHLSARRPLQRRAYSCAHELGASRFRPRLVDR